MKDHSSQLVYSGLTCRIVAEQASSYLEDQLPPFTRIRVRLHVRSCAHCRAYVAQIGLISSALRSLPRLYISPLNRLRLRQEFAARHAKKIAHP